MNKKIINVFILIIMLLLYSCSAGYRAYKKGDYFKASEESIKTLMRSPGNQKAQFVLSKAYPLAMNAAQREIEKAQAGNESDRYYILVEELEKVNYLADLIYKCIKANEIIPTPVEFISELSEAKQNAAHQSYIMGEKSMTAGTVEQARKAFYYFTNANNYVPGYLDVLRRIEDARYLATIRVLIEKPETSPKYQLTANFFSDNFISEITKNQKNQFVRFYTPEEAYNLNMNDPHHVLVLDFSDFRISSYNDKSNVQNFKRDSVKAQSKNAQGKHETVYITANAKVTTYIREIVSSGLLNVRIYETISNKLLQQRTFEGKYVWSTTWGRYSGDDRALTEAQKAFCRRNPEIPPNNQQLFYEFTQPIFNPAVSYIRSVYSKY